MSKVKITDIEEAVRKKVFTPESFHLALITLVEEGKAENLIDAVGVFCGENDVDGAELAQLVDDSLKGKLKTEAEKCNLLRGEKPVRLPI